MSQRSKKIQKSGRRPAPRRAPFRLSGLTEIWLEDRTVPTDFSNLNPIAIPGSGATGTGTANPYPSTISVSGLTGQQITNLQVLFHNLSHDSPSDIDAMLIA